MLTNRPNVTSQFAAVNELFKPFIICNATALVSSVPVQIFLKVQYNARTYRASPSNSLKYILVETDTSGNYNTNP